MFQSKVYASGKWASGTHDEERREGGLVYVKMASIQEEIEEEARTPPSPPTQKAAEAWCTRRKFGRIDDARRTKDLLEADARPDDEYYNGGGNLTKPACDLGSTGLVLRASGCLPHEDAGGGGLQAGGGRNYALFLQNMEERNGYGWTDSQPTVNFPPYYLERQDSGLSIISTISELAEDTEELEELSDEDEEGGQEAASLTTLVEEGGKAEEGLHTATSDTNLVQADKKCKKKISFWDRPEEKSNSSNTVSVKQINAGTATVYST
jgi:hypothetical protein